MEDVSVRVPGPRLNLNPQAFIQAFHLPRKDELSAAI